MVTRVDRPSPRNRLRGHLSRLDPFITLLLATVALATVLPARGAWRSVFDGLANGAIILLFFVHGAKLSRAALLDGIRNWQLHGATASVTFLLFPTLGFAITRLGPLDSAAATGLLFLTLLPSTVQSSIAFTAMAGGNVAAAVCSASLSNLLGVFATPLLATILLGAHGGGSRWGAVGPIALHLLLPFAVGHLFRPLLGAVLTRHKAVFTTIDRGSILLVVYTAFGAAVLEGLWRHVSLLDLAGILAASLVLLAAVLGATWRLGGLLGLAHADRIVLLFCGSKKSLASGVPMAGLLFPPASVGLIILPLMIFHQVQLIACAILARRVSTVSLS